ncbi:hypothetical protein DSL72_005334 [Monilinia vaccinii-corymbosi]|uniref:Aminopeptidase n=1 Tax=Monilinia vaccinii-corymbosi TaxID=61207 RepID=A0A8A3PFD2_9HELO|nr:hypothetical protein DSL72_005334 [Monilinia vaccinii-corymbosi]
MASSTSDRDILPDSAKPSHYALSIYDIELGGAFSYQGSVNIDIKIVKATKEITLNAYQLKIHEAEVSFVSGKTIKSSEISYDTKKQRVTLSFPAELSISENTNLAIKYQGTVNNDMAGFYYSKYKPQVTPAASVPKVDEFHCMYSTQFESSDARRAFPCFDEPNLKATFDFEIEIPKDQIALSNMPEKGSRISKDGYHFVEFERTPIMSTYLLAWAMGDFEYIEDFTKRKYNGKQIPVRVYTTRGLKSQAQYALDHAPKVIDLFSEIFDIDYPLPKADLLAVHEFSHGAMENWGLVTYRTTAVLFDEKTSDTKFKNRIAYVVAHELAHQWFGNLVTMDWWSELWLNEGFATWVGWLATDHFHPDWCVWPQFVAEGMQTAFQLDSLRSSHPIEVPVKDALDVDQIFDSISYLKGSSVLRMLATHLGQKTFLKGVSNYLKAHAYGNATTQDLWSALSEASGLDVKAIIDPWITKMGYPVLTVAEEPGKISIKQSRYLSTGDVKPEDDETTWWVPLDFQGKAGTKGAQQIAFEQKEDTVRDVDDSFYKINTDTAGFYRVNYPPGRLAKLGTQLDRLSLTDKIGLIADAGALAISGQAGTSAFLTLVQGLSDESNYLVWTKILGPSGTIKSVFSDDDAISDGMKAFLLKLVTPAVEKIGWEQPADEDFLKSQLRPLLILSAGINGHKEIIAEAKRRFDLYTSGKDKSAIHPSLRTAIFGLSVRYGGKSEYDALKKEYRETTSIDGKEITLRAMGRVQTPELIADYFEFLFKEVATQDVHTGAAALAANTKTRYQLWQYIQNNFEPVKERLSANMVVFDRFIKVSLASFSDDDVNKQIEKFFENKDNRGYDRSLAIISDTIRGRAALKARDRKVILEWLQANSYC